MQEEEVLLAAGGCDRVGDGVGFILAGGLAVLEPMTVPQRIAAVKAARKRARIGTLVAAELDVAAAALHLFLADGRPDGLGYAVAGGLAVLEPMTLPQRIAAVNAARNKHAIIGGSRGQGPAEMPGAG